MTSANDRSWIIRLLRRSGGEDETLWYSGYGGVVQYRVSAERGDAHHFDRFPDAVVTKEGLLSSGVADADEIEED